jgi:acetyl esterase/lipase
VAPKIHPTANTAAFRFVRGLPDNIWGLRMMHAMAYATGWTTPKGLSRQKLWLPRENGGRMRVEVFRPASITDPLPIVLYLHGGGFAIGAPRQDFAMFARLMAARPCIIVAPHYQRSLQAPFPAALQDCHNTLLWMRQNAKQLGALDDPPVVMGPSAGGGLAAALCLLARDRASVPIAAQILIGAMLDDRTRSTELRPSDLSWSLGKNTLAWRLYMNGKPASEYSSPARACDLTGLPPAFGIVGDCDLFYVENGQYFRRLADAGVAADLQVVLGGYHGVDVFAPTSQPGKEMPSKIGEAFMKVLGSAEFSTPSQDISFGEPPSHSNSF